MSEVKEAIVLAGGFGTRLKKVVKDVPKPMADINGKPFLHYLIRYYERKGIRHVVLSVGYLNNIIKDYFKDRYGKVKISYAVEEEPLGTGGAIIRSLELCETDTVMAANGDTMFLVEPQDVFDFHMEKKADLTMVVREVEDVSRYGSVMLDGNSRITGFAEKNSQTGKGFINGGVYLINRSFISGFSFSRRFSIEKDFFEKEFMTSRFFGKPCGSYFIDIGIPEDYNRAKKDFISLLT